MRALRERVHSGIGATSTVNADALGTNLFDRAFEMVLDSIAVPLTLPPGKGSAVIRDDQL
jgi:hypothetical protein